jgi:hypothetical protein
MSFADKLAFLFHLIGCFAERAFSEIARSAAPVSPGVERHRKPIQLSAIRAEWCTTAKSARLSNPPYNPNKLPPLRNWLRIANSLAIHATAEFVFSPSHISPIRAQFGTTPKSS